MELLETAKLLASQPAQVILALGLVVTFILWRRDITRFETREREHSEQIEALHARSEERDAQYTSLVRESVVALTRVADVLR
jgi:flagellar biosynthesis/type III secretory pathway M-ring protein FliF/YscJ